MNKWQQRLLKMVRQSAHYWERVGESEKPCGVEWDLGAIYSRHELHDEGLPAAPIFWRSDSARGSVRRCGNIPSHVVGVVAGARRGCRASLR